MRVVPARAEDYSSGISEVFSGRRVQQETIITVVQMYVHLLRGAALEQYRDILSISVQSWTVVDLFIRKTRRGSIVLRHSLV